MANMSEMTRKVDWYINENPLDDYYKVNLSGGVQATVDVVDKELNLEFKGGVGGETTSSTVTTNYTIIEDDYKKWIKASGSITITVPVTPSDYFECIIQNVGTGTITISGIANAVGNKITERWRACHIYYDGTAWTAVGALEL